MLERGFWLYVWRVETPEGEYLYVGRTGDASSPHASAPYRRLGQHLSHRREQNALRRNLELLGIVPEQCDAFHLVAHGPLFPEVGDMEAHRGPRDIVAALEKALADALRGAGYRVLNTVACRKPLDEVLFASVRTAFAADFPALLRSAPTAENSA